MEYFEDGINVRTNSVTITGICGPAYNAVIDSVFSSESETEPVTLTEAKDWCKIDVSDDDTLIGILITAARKVCENYSNISFITRTVTATLHNGLGRIDLPYGPVTGDVAYKDEDDNALTDFDIKIPSGGYFKAVYTAGYSDLPKNLKIALLNQIAWMYENRGDAKVASGVSELSKLVLNQVRKFS